MSEEYNFVEEIEELFETAAAAKADAFQDPLEEFAFWLRELGRCASYGSSCVSLDRSRADVLAADASEAFMSKSVCREMAQKRVDKALREAEQKMQARASVSGDKSFFFAFRKRFDDCLEVLCEKLELLRTPENAVIVDELRSCLTASRIHGKAKEIYDDLSEKYRLQNASVYYSGISYDVWDPSDFETGLARLFAKGFMRYGFSCCEAIHTIEQDAQAALEGFQVDLNLRIQDEILANLVEPVQRLLPKLREPAI